MNLQELQVLLGTEPQAEEISFLPDGARYLSIDVVRKKADLLFDKWEHSNFVFTSFIHERDTWASGSINTTVYFSRELDYAISNITTFVAKEKRKLSGAATIRLKDYGSNPHFAATLKSLCIVNALSNEYACFGKNLNEGMFSTVPDVEPAGKHYPDAIVNQKFNNAISRNEAALAFELFEQYDLSKHPQFERLKFDEYNKPFILPF